MPSGPSHWHTFWEDDSKPYEYLKSRGYTFPAGMIRPRTLTPWAEIDILDKAAISYLIEEWDYGYSPEPTTTA